MAKNKLVDNKSDDEMQGFDAQGMMGQKYFKDRVFEKAVTHTYVKLLGTVMSAGARSYLKRFLARASTIGAPLFMENCGALNTPPFSRSQYGLIRWTGCQRTSHILYCFLGYEIVS
eukprot:scaffold9878_cov64-Cylindrotheca_fusiformis.AAC.2